MKKLMILTSEEVTLIERHRVHNEAKALIKKQRDNCEHTFRFSAHCHNDTAYECTKCGEIEYR